MKFFRDLTIACLVAVLAVVASEAFLRLMGLHFQASFYSPNPERTFTYRPLAEGWQTSEAENYVRINSHGQHDREHALRRPEDTIRIAVVGASEPAAIQVQENETFISLLEPALNRRLAAAGKKVETIDFAVDGYNLAQIYLTLRDDVWRFDPQIVVLPYSVFLALKNIPEINPDTKTAYLDPVQLDPTAPAVIFPTSTRLRLRSLAARVMNSSQFLSLGNLANIKLTQEKEGWFKKLREMRATGEDKNSTGAASRSDALPQDYLAVWPFFDPDDASVDPRVKKSSQLGDALLVAMDRMVRQHHAQFMLAILDYPPQLSPAPTREAFQREHNLPHLDAAENRLLRFCAQNDITAFAIAPALASRIPAGLAIRGFPGGKQGEGHYNHLGHQLLSEYLADVLAGNPVFQSARN